MVSISPELKAAIQEIAKEDRDREQQGTAPRNYIRDSQRNEKYKDFRYAYEWYMRAQDKTYHEAAIRYADQRVDAERKRADRTIATLMGVSMAVMAIAYVRLRTVLGS